MGLQKYRADAAGERQRNGGIPCYTHWIGGPTLALIRQCKIESAPGYVTIAPRTVIGPHGSAKYGYRAIHRAIDAGIVRVASGERRGAMYLYPCEVPS